MFLVKREYYNITSHLKILVLFSEIKCTDVECNDYKLTPGQVKRDALLLQVKMERGRTKVTVDSHLLKDRN